eukprot:EG_transcript_43024
MGQEEEPWVTAELDAALAALAAQEGPPDEAEGGPPAALWGQRELAAAAPLQDGHFKYDCPVHFDGDGQTVAKWELPAFQEFMAHAAEEAARLERLEEAIRDLYGLRDAVAVPERLEVYVQHPDELPPLTLEEFGGEEG